MPFGQLVIGPPGSGKSTYCYGMYQFLSAIGRKVSVINLDVANDKTIYPCALDVRNFIKLEDVMSIEFLGPNGGVIRALEELESNWKEFFGHIENLKDEYLIFDCPGQVELFTHHSSIKNIFTDLERSDYRLAVVNLIDSFYLTSPSQYVSILLLTLRTMLQLNLPQINVFSKIDLLSSYGRLDFPLDFYTEVQDIEKIYPLIEKESSVGKKYSNLTKAIGDVVADFGLVSFEVLAVEDKASMISILSVIDKATGYAFGSTELGGDTIWVEATRQGGYTGGVSDIQERWIDYKDHYDKLEAEKMESLNEEIKQKTKPLSKEEEWEEALKEWEKANNKSIRK